MDYIRLLDYNRKTGIKPLTGKKGQGDFIYIWIWLSQGLTDTKKYMKNTRRTEKKFNTQTSHEYYKNLVYYWAQFLKNVVFFTLNSEKRFFFVKNFSYCCQLTVLGSWVEARGYPNKHGT